MPFQPNLVLSRLARKTPWLKVVLILAAWFMAFCLTACQSELYSGLTEQEANAMLVLLLSQDFEAAKVDKGKSGFSLTVDQAQMAVALELLTTNGFPRTKHESMGTVFSGQGMISTQTEEPARLSYALAQELSETFSRIDGVLTARVHVVLATRDQSGSLSSPATVAVVIRHLPESPVANLSPKIKEISAKSVPGLLENGVSIMLVPVRIEVILPTVSKPGLLSWPRALGLVLLVLAAGFLVTRLLLKRRRGRAEPLG
ncbi:MAG: type III secretion inner membrane ring lipoprotein SctJ [Deltaproteobacteria bacterium]|jgi:type III secretion protein J|nr:type III secretion inner membrane ring lipoprotein SctJ [Deltaproteobacteria bacterium]